MAKEGLEYFPLSCTLNDKVELIEAEFGLKGFAIVVKLLQKIYGDKGYYCEWNDEVRLLFSRKNCGMESDNLVSEVVNAALKRGLFDVNMFQQFGILTSAGIQKRYFEAAKRRNKIDVKNNYLLLNVRKSPENVCKNGKNVCKNDENAYISQQRKEEERKVKESKGNNKNILAPSEQGAKEKKGKYGEYGNVLLTDSELNRLFKDYGEAETLKAIDYLDASIEMKGYKYKSHNLALRKWVFRSMKEDELRDARLANYNRSTRAPQTEEQFYGGILDFLKGDQENGSETIQ